MKVKTATNRAGEGEEGRREIGPVCREFHESWRGWGEGREGFYDLNSTCALISPRIIFPIFIFRILSIADIPSGDKAGCFDGDAGNIRLLLRNKMQIILYKLDSVLCLSSIGYEDRLLSSSYKCWLMSGMSTNPRH